MCIGSMGCEGCCSLRQDLHLSAGFCLYCSCIMCHKYDDACVGDLLCSVNLCTNCIIVSLFSPLIWKMFRGLPGHHGAVACVHINMR